MPGQTWSSVSNCSTFTGNSSNDLDGEATIMSFPSEKLMCLLTRWSFARQELSFARHSLLVLQFWHDQRCDPSRGQSCRHQRIPPSHQLESTPWSRRLSAESEKHLKMTTGLHRLLSL